MLVWDVLFSGAGLLQRRSEPHVSDLHPILSCLVGMGTLQLQALAGITAVMAICPASETTQNPNPPEVGHNLDRGACPATCLFKKR